MINIKLKPFEQFNLKSFLDLNIAGYNFGLTNSTLYMLLTVLCLSFFLFAAVKRRELVPGKLQAMGELIHNFVLETLNENTLGAGQRYFPFIFTMFCFILTMNLLGLTPESFSVTSHLSVTFALAIIMFIMINIVAFSQHGLKFFSHFLPKGMPMFIAPIMVVIELFVYLIRPATLAVRLAANMIAGHILLYVAAMFITIGGIYVGIIPLSFTILFTGFEFFVAILQAYIFTILSCVYLNDAIHLH